MSVSSTPVFDKGLQRLMRRAVADSNNAYLPAGALAKPTGELVRAGKAGGLPFDSLLSDIVVGCLPAKTACYGSCFAAMASFQAGVDFGVRVANTLDEDLLCRDLDALPLEQRFLRIGWNSDPSWDWELTARIGAILRARGLHMIAVSKSFTRLKASTVQSLAAAGVELRISVSAFDSDAQLRHRFDTMLRHRDAGGVAVPLVMTTRFKDAGYQARQESILQDVLGHDLPGAENSLRFPQGSPVAKLLDPDEVRPLAGSGDLWGGRLYAADLTVPTTTSLPASYSGLPSGYRSRLPLAFLGQLFHEPVRTHEEVLLGPPLHKPTQCGVARL
jgi:hypothetical protein